MTTFFIISITILCLYIAFKDLVHRKDLEGKDLIIQDLAKMAKAKTPKEYEQYRAEEPKEMKGEDDPYVDVWDMTDEQVNKATTPEPTKE